MVFSAGLPLLTLAELLGLVNTLLYRKMFVNHAKKFMGIIKRPNEIAI